MAKRLTDTEKWKKKWIRELPLKYKLVWVYLTDTCNHAGVWDVEMDVLNLRLGIDLKEDEILAAFGNRINVIDKGLKWHIPSFLEFQYGELNPDNRVHESVITILNRYGIKPLVSPLQGAKDKDKDKDKDKRGVIGGRFVRPSINHIVNYCIERKNKVDPEAFYNFYESKGWMVGKNIMKDWRAAVRTWERNESSQKSESKVDFKKIEKMISSKLDKIATKNMIKSVMLEIPQTHWWMVDKFLKKRYPDSGGPTFCQVETELLRERH